MYFFSKSSGNLRFKLPHPAKKVLKSWMWFKNTLYHSLHCKYNGIEVVATSCITTNCLIRTHLKSLMEFD